MQTKKKELGQTILNVAKHEFLIHGFKNSSLRTIAQKSNTTIGNLYHYFLNKDAMLDELLYPYVCSLEIFMNMHTASAYPMHSVEEIDDILDQIDMDTPEINLLLSEEFVILMRTDVERYVSIRDEFMQGFEKHLAWHLHANEDNHFIRIVANMIIDCLIHLNRCSQCSKQKKDDFILMFRMLCKGIIDKTRER